MRSFIRGHFAGQFQFLSKSDNSDGRFICVCACKSRGINPLNAGLNPICHLLALLGAHHILHISGVRVNQIFVTTSRSQTKFPDTSDMYTLLPEERSGTVG